MKSVLFPSETQLREKSVDAKRNLGQTDAKGLDNSREWMAKIQCMGFIYRVWNQRLGWDAEYPIRPGARFDFI